MAEYIISPGIPIMIGCQGMFHEIRQAYERMSYTEIG